VTGAKITLRAQVCYWVSAALLSAFFLGKGLIALDLLDHSRASEVLDFVVILVMAPFGHYYVMEYLASQRRAHEEVLAEIQGKNAYLEHAAKILRHDMHSGINTYIPRGISSLERRLTPAVIKELKLEAPLRLLRDGLAHTQKVYWGVYEFTNLVKQGAKLNMEERDLGAILSAYLSTTSYKDQVVIDRLPTIRVNEPLFCTAIDNLIRNGLKYNDSEFKMVALTMLDDSTLAVIDNGRGMSQEDFELYSRAYARKEGQKEKGTGLGLNICIAILREHGFSITCQKQDEGGTLIKVKIR
jgi:signal transduction histidine kinase